jgi:cyclic-di-GMP-binding biofilm dispersal mediator protein
VATVELTNKRTLVLGGSGELGSRIADQLIASGARVMLAGRSEERLERRAAGIAGNPPYVSFDLRDDRPETVIDAAVRQLGGLDGLVNAAGVVAFGPLATLSDAALDELVAVDFTGPLRVIRAALPHLSGGFIVNITGVIAEQPFPGMTAYSAAKAGLSAATRALARELRRERIHVLDARPPHTETGLAARPIEGAAPPLPAGLAPDAVARRIVSGLLEGERELAAADFGP